MLYIQVQSTADVIYIYTGTEYSMCYIYIGTGTYTRIKCMFGPIHVQSIVVIKCMHGNIASKNEKNIIEYKI